MTVEELIEVLKKEDPHYQVFTQVICYTPIRRYSPATKPVCDPVDHIFASLYDRKVYLIPDQEKVYG